MPSSTPNILRHCMFVTQSCFMPNLLKIDSVDFTNFINVFSLCRCYLSLQKGMTLQLNRLESIDSLCQFLLKFVLKMLFCIFKLFTSLSRKVKLLSAIQTNPYLLLFLRWYHFWGYRFSSHPFVDFMF